MGMTRTGQVRTVQQADTVIAGTFLQRKCACGQHTVAGGECEECRQKREGMLQRAAVNTAPLASNGVPSIVHDVLSSPGRPLDAGTRAFMEPRFGHDFSQVRMHTDARAVESAQAVNALAYTVGRDVVFGAGQYGPRTSEGRRLLAHELTHVLQQTVMPSDCTTFLESAAETEAQQNAARIITTEVIPVRVHSNARTIQREREELDKNAMLILDIAQDPKRTPEKRATDTIWYILGQYYPSEKSKVSKVIYVKKRVGLLTEVSGEGAEITGAIEVGDNFVTDINKYTFGRKVLQVKHELEHIDQHREGMTGEGEHDEREFLAFYHEALGTPPPGTGGEMQRSMRAHLIDTAIGYYYCLANDLQKKYKSDLQKLLERRPRGIKGSYKRASPPTSCERPPEDKSER